MAPGATEGLGNRRLREKPVGVAGWRETNLGQRAGRDFRSARVLRTTRKPYFAFGLSARARLGFAMSAPRGAMAVAGPALSEPYGPHLPLFVQHFAPCPCPFAPIRALSRASGPVWTPSGPRLGPVWARPHRAAPLAVWPGNLWFTRGRHANVTHAG